MNKLIELTNYQKEILYGVMLGDGGLYKNKNSVNFNYTTKDYNTVYQIYKIFENFSIPSCINGPKTYKIFDKRTNKEYTQNVWRSKCNLSLKIEYDNWYLNKIKFIPNNLILTPNICLWWYIGDGSISKNAIKLSTNCFNKDDLSKIIIPQLNQFEAKIYITEKKPIIIIPKRKIKLFLNYIGECPIETMSYRWKFIEYKNKNIEQNGFNLCNKETIEQIKILFNDKLKPFKIAKQLNIHITTVKHQLKKLGLFKSNTENNQIQNYIVTDPNYNVYNVYNLSAFCKINNLNLSGLNNVANGWRKHYKQWKCVKLFTIV